jgi:hypothetical protein
MRVDQIQGLVEAYSQVHETTNDLFEEVENWVNSLLEEGYDLSEYTWEEMYEAYLSEGAQDSGAGARQLFGKARRAYGDVVGAAAQGFTGQKTTSSNPLSRAYNAATRAASAPTRAIGDFAKGFVTGKGSTSPAKPSAGPTKSKFAGARDAAFEKARQIKGSPVVGSPPAGGSGGSAKSTAPRSAAPKQTTTPATSKPTDGAERRTPTSAELRSAQSARSSALAAGKTKPEAEKSAVQAGVDRGTKLMGGPEGPGKIDTSSVQRDLAKANAPKPSTPSTPSSTATAKPSAPSLQQSIRNRRLNMDLDLFDLVKGYLLDEGYAETEEAAIVMMVNMSEGWRESILESCGVQLGESQHARENPEDHDKEEKKKYEKVRGEKTPMPPRGDKRREDFEKWYAANVR